MASFRDLLDTNQLQGQRVLNGLDYCMVKVGRKGSALHSKESENHQEKQKEYKAISNRLKQNSSPYGCVTDNGPEGQNQPDDTITGGLTPKYSQAMTDSNTMRYSTPLSYQPQSTESRQQSRFDRSTITSESTRSEMRHQLHIQLDRLTSQTSSDDSTTSTKLTMSHGNPKIPPPLYKSYDDDT